MLHLLMPTSWIVLGVGACGASEWRDTGRRQANECRAPSRAQGVYHRAYQTFLVPVSSVPLAWKMRLFLVSIRVIICGILRQFQLRPWSNLRDLAWQKLAARGRREASGTIAYASTTFVSVCFTKDLSLSGSRSTYDDTCVNKLPRCGYQVRPRAEFASDFNVFLVMQHALCQDTHSRLLSRCLVMQSYASARLECKVVVWPLDRLGPIFAELLCYTR